MTYLIVEIFLFLALAFGLGLFLGWAIWRRSGETADCTETERRLADSQSQVRNLQRRVDTLTSERLHHSPVPDRPVSPDEAADLGTEAEALAADVADEAEAVEAEIVEEVATPQVASSPTDAAFVDDLADAEMVPPAPPPAILPTSEPETTTPEPPPAPAYDDLQRISGIGPVIEQQLAELGVTTYRQIARFSEDDIERVGRHLDVFPDRVRREKWVQQAATLHRKTYGTQP